MWMKTSTPLTHERWNAARLAVEHESKKLVDHRVQLVWLPALVGRAGQPTVQRGFHGGGEVVDRVHADESPVPTAGQNLPWSARAVGRDDRQAAGKRLDQDCGETFPA